MKQPGTLLRFLIYSNLFIAGCALAQSWETFVLLRLPASQQWYLLLIFLCTLFVYCLHYYAKSRKDKQDARIDWSRKHHRLLLFFVISSAIFIAGGVIWHFNHIFLLNGVFNYSNLAWFIIIPLAALAYSHPLNPFNKKSLRQTGWVKVLLLSFIWSFTTTVLPVWMLHPSMPAVISTTVLTAIFVHRFFFIFALCVLFNIYDYEEDKADGISTFAVMAGPANSLRYGKWITFAFNLLSAGWLLYSLHSADPIFIAALLVPAVWVWWLFIRFKPATDEVHFIFRYDGMMIVQALLCIFAVLIRKH